MVLAAHLDRRSVVVVTLIVVALLLCAIFMPAMAMAALVGCAVAILVTTERVRRFDLHFPRTPPTDVRRTVFRMTPSTGPPIIALLRT